MFLFNRIAFYNIRAALLVFVLLPFLITIVATGWYGLYRLEASAKAAMEEEIELLARAIRLPLSHALQHGHSGTLQRSVTSIFDIDKVYAVYVYDKDGRRISTSGSSKARVQDREAVDLANKGDEQGEFDEVGGEEVFSYFLPLTDSGENSIGLLQVTRRGSDFLVALMNFARMPSPCSCYPPYWLRGLSGLVTSERWGAIFIECAKIWR